MAKLVRVSTQANAAHKHVMSYILLLFQVIHNSSYASDEADSASQTPTHCLEGRGFISKVSQSIGFLRAAKSQTLNTKL